MEIEREGRRSHITCTVWSGLVYHLQSKSSLSYQTIQSLSCVHNNSVSRGPRDIISDLSDRGPRDIISDLSDRGPRDIISDLSDRGPRDIISDLSDRGMAS